MYDSSQYKTTRGGLLRHLHAELIWKIYLVLFLVEVQMTVYPHCISLSFQKKNLKGLNYQIICPSKTK